MTFKPEIKSSKVNCARQCNGTLQVFFQSSKEEPKGSGGSRGADDPCSVEGGADGPPSFEEAGGEEAVVTGVDDISVGTFTYIGSRQKN